jgi:hypothetical protein
VGAPGRGHRDRYRRLRVAVLDEPLNNLSSNQAEQDRDREEQPFRLRIPLFRPGRVRLLILLLVTLHAPSYTKQAHRSPRTRAGPRRYLRAPGP